MTFLQPKRVAQVSLEDCWAAALESWVDSLGMPDLKPKQRALVKQILAEPESGGKHGIKNARFITLAKTFAMDPMWFNLAEFTSTSVEGLLKVSNVFVAFRSVTEPGVEWWHAVVVYGVLRPPRDEPLFQMMDPDGGQYRNHWKQFFHPVSTEEELLVGVRDTTRRIGGREAVKPKRDSKEKK